MVDDRLTPNDESLNAAFAALADPTRRRLVERLGEGPATVSELAAPFQMALPSVLKHLAILERSGLVRSSKAGRTRSFAIEPGATQQIDRWLATQKQRWNRRFDRMAQVLEDEADHTEGDR